MRYQGGKRRSAKFIAPFIARLRADDVACGGTGEVGDLFLGSCGIEKACAAVGAPVTVGAEICPAIVACYRAVAAGWVPPATLTREEYNAIKLAHGPDSTDPLAAFGLAFCAYSGTWGGGWHPDDLRWKNPTTVSAAAKAQRDLLALAPLLRTMRLECADYRTAAEIVPAGGVLYLDPPWRGTMPYKQAPPFDADAFWTWAAVASLRWRVIVSEGPKGPPAGNDSWACAWRHVVPLRGLVTDKVECLWYRRGGLAARVLTEVSCNT